MSQLRRKDFSQTPTSSDQRNQSPIGFSLELELDSNQTAKKIKECVFIELNKSFERRSQANITQNGKYLCLEINAQDLIALRASFNSIMQSIILSYQIFKNF